MRLRSDGLSTRTLDDEMIVLDLQSSRYLSVTGVGVRIVELLSEERSTQELIEALQEEYLVDAEVARRDTESFLAQLRAAGLLEP